MKIDLNKLSVRQLDSLLAAAERRQVLLSTRRPAAVVRRKVSALAVSLGYAIEELIDVRPLAAAKPMKKRRSVRLVAKYRDPENKRLTWSGRGRMPRWLADRRARGQSVADFLIPGLARPTAKKNSRIGQRSVYKKG